MDLTASPPPRTLKRDRTVVLAVLAFLSFFSWLFIFYEARGMNNGTAMCCAVPSMRAWGLDDFFLIFIMWAVMMMAMMIPSATPMILMFASVNRKRREKENPFVATWIFLLGYITVWTGFSMLATLVQWYLHAKALLSSMMVSTNSLLGGFVLVVAGLFQLTPLKDRCLSYCQTPLSFLMTQWREGTWGTFVMGLRHGIFCTGCCWALMALLFVAGVMNLFWIALISIFVLLEKIAPKYFYINRVSGLLLILWGIFMLTGKF